MASAEPATVTVGPVAMPRRRLMALVAWSTIVVMVAYIMAPAIGPGVLVGCVVPPLLWCLADGVPLSLGTYGRDAFDGRSAGLLLLMYVAWMLISVLWSPNPRVGISAIVWGFAVLALTFIATVLGSRVASDARRDLALAFLIAFVIGLAAVFIEALTDMGFRRVVMSLVPGLRTLTPGVVVENGWVTMLPFFLIKKNVAVVMVMFWPALLIAIRLARHDRDRNIIRLVVALAVVTILIAGHDTSKVALTISGAVWMLTTYRPQWAQRTVLSLWLVASLAVVPLALVAYKANLQAVTAIQYSGRHRIVIWGQTAEHVLRKPVIGAGIAATRYLDETSTEAVIIPGTDIAAGMNIHSHNIFLQTWHELGGIGAVLLCLAGLPLLNWIGRRSGTDRPYLYAVFTAVAAIASLSWSLIAAWFVATFGIAVVLTQLSAHVADETRDASGSAPAV